MKSNPATPWYVGQKESGEYVLLQTKYPMRQPWLRAWGPFSTHDGGMDELERLQGHVGYQEMIRSPKSGRFIKRARTVKRNPAFRRAPIFAPRPQPLPAPRGTMASRSPRAPIFGARRNPGKRNSREMALAVANRIAAISDGVLNGPDRGYVISEVSLRLNRSDLTGALSVAYQAAKPIAAALYSPSEYSTYTLDQAAEDIVGKIGASYMQTAHHQKLMRRNPGKRGLSRSAFMPFAKVDTRDGGFTFGMDYVTPVIWIFGRARKLPKGSYVWWLPDEPAVHEFVRDNKTWIGSYNDLARKLKELRGAMQKNPRRRPDVYAVVIAPGGKVIAHVKRPASKAEIIREVEKLAAKRGETLRVETTQKLAANPINRLPSARHEIIISRREAARIVGGARNLPRPGYEKKIAFEGKEYWLGETVHQGKSAYWLREIFAPAFGPFPMRRNPAPRLDQNAVEKAARRFSRFTGHRADKLEMLPFPGKPRAGLAVGPVLMVGYSAMRDGKRENYLHKFATHARPMLVASDDGKSLHLIGGRYTFTERGIVDTRK